MSHEDGAANMPLGWEGPPTSEPLDAVANIAGHLRRELAVLLFVGEDGRGEFWLEQANALYANVFRVLNELRIVDRPRQRAKAKTAEEAERQLSELWRCLAERAAKPKPAEPAETETNDGAPAVSGVSNSVEQSPQVVETAGDLWKAYAEGKRPCFQSSGLSIRPGRNTPIISCTDAASEAKRIALDRAQALVTAEGGDKAAAMERLIARVQLHAGMDKPSVINMPLAEFVAAAMDPGLESGGRAGVNVEGMQPNAAVVPVDDLITVAQIGALLNFAAKTIRNRMSENRSEPDLPKPAVPASGQAEASFRYFEFRLFLLRLYPKKTAHLPCSFAEVQKILAARQSSPGV